VAKPTAKKKSSKKKVASPPPEELLSPGKICANLPPHLSSFGVQAVAAVVACIIYLTGRHKKRGIVDWRLPKLHPVWIDDRQHWKLCMTENDFFEFMLALPEAISPNIIKWQRKGKITETWSPGWTLVLKELIINLSRKPTDELEPDDFVNMHAINHFVEPEDARKTHRALWALTQLIDQADKDSDQSMMRLLATYQGNSLTIDELCELLLSETIITAMPKDCHEAIKKLRQKLLAFISDYKRAKRVAGAPVATKSDQLTLKTPVNMHHAHQYLERAQVQDGIAGISALCALTKEAQLDDDDPAVQELARLNENRMTVELFLTIVDIPNLLRLDDDPPMARVMPGWADDPCQALINLRQAYSKATRP
jgi:hypothetical protein